MIVNDHMCIVLLSFSLRGTGFLSGHADGSIVRYYISDDSSMEAQVKDLKTSKFIMICKLSHRRKVSQISRGAQSKEAVSHIKPFQIVEVPNSLDIMTQNFRQKFIFLLEQSQMIKTSVL